MRILILSLFIMGSVPSFAMDREEFDYITAIKTLAKSLYRNGNLSFLDLAIKVADYSINEIEQKIEQLNNCTHSSTISQFKTVIELLNSVADFDNDKLFFDKFVREVETNSTNNYKIKANTSKIKTFNLN